MYKCSLCKYQTEKSSNFERHEASVHNKQEFCCKLCGDIFNRKDNMNRHMLRKHKNINSVRIYQENNADENKNDLTGKDTAYQCNVNGSSNDEFQNFDIRLKENFKLFISGPSRCGKTVFVSKLIENIQSFAKQPPGSIIYVYKVWQDKYEEMESFGVNFIEDHENIIDQI